MATAQNVAEQSAHLCVGALAVVLGPVGPAGGIAAPLAVLSVVGAQWLRRGRLACHGTALAGAIHALDASPDFTPDALARASHLLDTKALARPPVLTAAQIGALSDPDTGIFASNVARQVAGALPFAPDDDHARAAILLALETTARGFLSDRTFRDAVNDVQIARIARDAGLILDASVQARDTARRAHAAAEAAREAVEAQNPIVAELVARVIALEEAVRAREHGVDPEVILEIARRYAPDAGDVDQALAGISAAIDQVLALKARGAAPSNHGVLADLAIARVRERILAADFDGAAAEAEGEWLREAEVEAAERAERAARCDRLAAEGLVAARLANDAHRAAIWVVRREEASGPLSFIALFNLWDHWFVRGRDKGLNFDLQVSIDLARASVDHARDADDRGAALNNLGNTLAMLGERESGTGRLRDAVAAYRAAHRELGRDRVPRYWARTQNNLGNALLVLGERQSDPDRLAEAVTAFRAALEERTRGRVALEWALTQHNLGNALRALGLRESGTGRLEEAVTAYRSALEERTRDLVPDERAMTLTGLGAVLTDLGEREGGTDRLEEAVAAYRAVLEQRTRDRVPLDWAMTQNNLGSALTELGKRESGTDCLEKAVTAYRAALEERTRDRVPLDWATTQNNLGSALTELGRRESGTNCLEKAVTAYRAALEERTRDSVPYGWATVQFNLANVEVAYFEKTRDVARLDAAEGTARAARDVFAAGRASHPLGKVDALLVHIAALRGG